MGGREFSFQVSDPCKISLHSKIGVTTAWIVWGNIWVPPSSFFFLFKNLLFLFTFFFLPFFFPFLRSVLFSPCNESS